MISFKDLKQKLSKHDSKVDRGIDKAGEMAKRRLHGRDAQIDSAVDRAKNFTRPQE